MFGPPSATGSCTTAREDYITFIAWKENLVQILRDVAKTTLHRYGAPSDHCHQPTINSLIFLKESFRGKGSGMPLTHIMHGTPYQDRGDGRATGNRRIPDLNRTRSVRRKVPRDNLPATSSGWRDRRDPGAPGFRLSNTRRAGDGVVCPPRDLKQGRKAHAFAALRAGKARNANSSAYLYPFSSCLLPRLSRRRLGLRVAATTPRRGDFADLFRSHSGRDLPAESRSIAAESRSHRNRVLTHALRRSSGSRLSRARRGEPVEG